MLQRKRNWDASIRESLQVYVPLKQ
ncbi:unnamed protein product, partial [Rotaria sp. Silwood1]